MADAWTLEDPGETGLGMVEGIMVFDDMAPEGEKLVAEVFRADWAPAIAALPRTLAINTALLEALEKIDGRASAAFRALYSGPEDQAEAFVAAANDVVEAARAALSLARGETGAET